MINYTSWTIILPNMNAVVQATSEKLHSQSEAGWTGRQTNGQTKFAPIGGF